MDLILILGCSAVGKKIFVGAVLEDASTVRESLGIGAQSTCIASGGEFGWPHGALGDTERLMSSVKAAGADVLSLKHQFRYPDDDLPRLVRAVTVRGGCARLTLLWLPGPERAARYWHKHQRNEGLRANGDAVLRFLDSENSQAPAELLGLETKRLHEKLANLTASLGADGLEVLFEVRRADSPYPIVPNSEV